MEQRADGTWITGTGQVIGNVHPHTAACDADGCAVHAPSEHPMNDLPTNMRETTLMERICEHGIGHPDPDSLRYFERIGHSGFGIHSCDGCCSAEARAARDAARAKTASAKEQVTAAPEQHGESLADALSRPVS